MDIPSGLIAYKLKSSDPTYMVPSDPMTGEEWIHKPVA